MKLLLQLFGGNGLSLFGRSRSKVTDNGAGSTGGSTPNKTTQLADVGRHSGTCRQSVDIGRNVADEPETVATPSSPAASCWSPPVNRICWGSPLARRAAAADLGSTKEQARLPRSRSLIRTNPWLPPSSPPADRRHHRAGGLGGRSPSPTVSVSCPSTPADSPAKSGRRWRLVEGPTGGGGSPEGTTPVASEGYCSVSSLCTMSEGTLSTTACSDEMQMSVDSLASLFPTLMSSSSTSFHDDKPSAFGDSVVDSGIVVEPDSVQRRDDFDALATPSTGSDRSSDCGTPTNKTTSLREHLGAVQAALERGVSDDHQFDADVFPFGSPARQRPGVAVLQRSDRGSPSALTQSRSVDEISSSLAASVERLHRGRAAVDGAFSRALAEDRRRARELARLRRRMVEAQRDVLLGTLRDLRRELDDQCRRLQAAYDVVLSARWPRLHANTAYAVPSLCQLAV